MAWRIEGGYPDHRFQGAWMNYEWDDCYWACADCTKSAEDHHADMVDWDDLSGERRALYLAQARAAYEIWFRAGSATSTSLDPGP